MATFYTEYDIHESLWAATQDNPLNLIATMDESAFGLLDQFLSAGGVEGGRVLDEAGPSQTANHRTGTLSGPGSDFVIVGSGLNSTSSWLVNGLIVDGADGLLHARGAMTIPLTGPNADNFTGTVNSLVFVDGTPGTDGFLRFEVEGALAVTATSGTFTVTRMHVERTILVELTPFTISGTITGNFKLGENEAEETVVLDNGGKVTGFEFNVDGTEFSASGFSVDAFDFFSAIDVASIDASALNTMLQLMSSGNDLITGGTGFQELRGFAGNDTMIAGGNMTAFSGGLGNDLFDGNGFTGHSIDDDGGIDTVRSYDGGTVTLGEGIEHLVMINGNQGIGNGLNNSITGNDNGNTLDGGAGNDTLVGGRGNTFYFLDSAGDKVGAEAVDGGFDDVVSSVTHTLLANYEALELQGVANINGTGNALDNLLGGNSGNNLLSGLGGHDDIYDNGGGNDTLLGGDGDDSLSGGDGNDRLDGGNGNDYLSGGNDNDVLLGGLGNDQLNGDSGTDSIDGGAGDDSLTGGSENDTLVAGAGHDIVNGGSGNNSMSGGDGNDSMNADFGNDTMDGGGGDDNIDGGEGSDLMTGGAGHDTVGGGSGSDQVAGGAGNDFLLGGGDIDRLDGGDGNDTLLGSGGVNTLLGGGGNDLLLIEDFASSIDGGAGIDTVVQSVGAGTLTLGAATENLTFTSEIAAMGIGNALANSMASGAGNDTLHGGGGNDTYRVQAGDTVDESVGGGTADHVILESGSFTLDDDIEIITNLGDGAGNIANGNALNNILNSGDGVLNSLIGGAGNDTYNVQAGDYVFETDTLQGGLGNTDLVVATLDDGQSYSIEFVGGVENLTLIDSGEGTVTGTGNALNNIISGSTIAGASNNLYGLGGADTLKGGAGNDRLEGGADNDRLEGGAGNDNYVLSVSNIGTTSLFGALGDTVVDSAGIDTLTLLGSAEGAPAVLTLATLPTGIENIDASGTSNLVLNIGGATGLAGNNLLIGGNDTVGTGDTLNGGAGNDTLIGGDGNDQLIGGAGNDWYGLTLFNDEGDGVTITNLSEVSDSGGTGDVMMLMGGDSFADNFDFVIGEDTSSPFEGVDASDATGGIVYNLTGNGANNWLVGSWGADSITGGAGNDTLGSGGNDSNGGGSDTLVGGAGNDTYLVRAGATVTEDTAGGTDHVIATLEDGDSVTLADNAENLTLLHSGEGTIYGNGNDGNNLITGALGDNVLNSLNGGGGNDTILGGTGNDSMYGGGGNDSLSAGAGDDSLNGGNGNDAVNGGLGDDSYRVGIKAAGLVVTLSDTITDTGGNDTLFVNNPEEPFASAPGMTFTYTMTAMDNLVVSVSSDIAAKITGSATANNISTSNGNDSVSGAAGNDSIFASYGNDTVLGGDGEDTLDGGEGGMDSLDGGNGNDLYRDGGGGAPNDVQTYVMAQVGDAIEAGGTPGGVDTLLFKVITSQFAGEGVDLDLQNAGYIENATWQGTGNIEILGNNLDNMLTAGAGNDFLDGGTGGEDTLVGGAGNDMIYGGNDEFDGFGGSDDSIDGGAGNDSLDGGEGADIVLGGLGDDNLYGGSGDEYDDDWGDSMDGGAGNDTLDGGEGGSDTMFGGLGNDSMTGGQDDGDGQDDSMSGDAGNDTMDGGFQGNDTMFGGDGNDVIDGGEGADNLSGGLGIDTLTGGIGDGSNDVLDGGGGNDTYFVEGSDLVTETMAGAAGGVDTVIADLDPLGLFMMSDNVERLTLVDDGNALGNSAANVITGGDSFNVLWGAGGNDTLTGGDGNDVFVVHSTAAGNVALIQDFDALEFDMIGLFTGEGGFGDILGEGLSDDEVANGTVATHATSQLIYTFSTGELFYDADGTGGGAKVLVAKFAAGSKPIELSSDDFAPFSGFGG